MAKDLTTERDELEAFLVEQGTLVPQVVFKAVFLRIADLMRDIRVLQEQSEFVNRG